MGSVVVGGEVAAGVAKVPVVPEAASGTRRRATRLIRPGTLALEPELRLIVSLVESRGVHKLDRPLEWRDLQQDRVRAPHAVRMCTATELSIEHGG